MDGNFITCTVDGPNQIHNRTPKLSSGYLSTSCCSRKPLCTLMPLSPHRIALATSFTDPTSLSPSMLSKARHSAPSLLCQLRPRAGGFWKGECHIYILVERGLLRMHSRRLCLPVSLL